MIGMCEDSDFDCKVWLSNKSCKESIAKAACGFTNATGGVIVVGMLAKRDADGVDVVQEESPVPNVEGVRSEVLDAIAKFVEPGIEGIQSKSIRLPDDALKGFVVVLVPESQGSPMRSVVTKEFYVRIGHQTIPMAYFQIEDRFGRRPHPKLVIDGPKVQVRASMQYGLMERAFRIVLKNAGRGIARFPAARFNKNNGISFPNYHDSQPVWQVSHADPEYSSVRGGANDVIYPGESLEIITLLQSEQRVRGTNRRCFKEVSIQIEAVCDGMPACKYSFEFPEYEIKG